MYQLLEGFLIAQFEIIAQSEPGRHG